MKVKVMKDHVFIHENVKHNIYNNENKNIMKSCMFASMATLLKCIPIEFMGWQQMQWYILVIIESVKLYLMCNVMKKRLNEIMG